VGNDILGWVPNGHPKREQLLNTDGVCANRPCFGNNVVRNIRWQERSTSDIVYSQWSAAVCVLRTLDERFDSHRGLRMNH